MNNHGVPVAPAHVSYNIEQKSCEHGVACVQVRLPYHVRVCVPCYKEDLEILRRTILAAYDALLPTGCSRTIYLCDDGKDPRKRKWSVNLPSPSPHPPHLAAPLPLFSLHLHTLLQETVTLHPKCSVQVMYATMSGPSFTLEKVCTFLYSDLICRVLLVVHHTAHE